MLTKELAHVPEPIVNSRDQGETCLIGSNWRISIAVGRGLLQAGRLRCQLPDAQSGNRLGSCGWSRRVRTRN